MHVEQITSFASGSRPELHRSGAAAPAARKTYHSSLVLVVDDDPDLLDVTRFALESEGFDVETAENGKEALAWLRTGRLPTVVLLDLMMPVMNGWKFLDEVAREPTLKAIPVVVVSAAGQVDLPAGAVAFLRKPISMQTLVDAIERHRRGVDEARS